jgi:type II secretory pathway component GspD/PulD (secretin)
MKKKRLLITFLILCAHCAFAIEKPPKGDFSTVKNIALSGAPLSQVLYILEELTGKSILRDSKLADVFMDLQIRQSISREEAIRAIESALAINNIAIIELGDGLLKAVSAKSAAGQSPHFIEHSLLMEAPSEKVGSKIFQLKYLDVDDFAKLITSLLHPEISSVIVFDESNSMLITDSISNLQRIELLLSKVDVPRHSVVDSQIFRIKHGDAGEIATLLNKVIKGQNGKNFKKNIPSPQSVLAGNTSPEELGAASSFQFSKTVTIEHDARSNSIVVCGTSKDIEQVESIINQIDVLLDQVRIEVIIAQVSLGKNQASGLDSFGFQYNVKPESNGSAREDDDNAWRHQPTVSKAIGAKTSETENIFTLGGNLKDFSLSAVFNKARNDSNVKILSAPTIVTTHNREALVKIVDSMPVIKSDISNTESTSLKSTIEYKEVGIELKVKPLIGINGIIQLEINQRVESKYGEVKINNNSMPLTTKREAVSFVSVCDGDAVVLAGLQEKSSSKSDGKLWLLGDIPVFGKLLFSPKSSLEKTTELIIFIKPTIISNPSEGRVFADKVLADSCCQDEITHYKETGQFLQQSDQSDQPSEKPTPQLRMCHGTATEIVQDGEGFEDVAVNLKDSKTRVRNVEGKTRPRQKAAPQAPSTTLPSAPKRPKRPEEPQRPVRSTMPPRVAHAEISKERDGTRFNLKKKPGKDDREKQWKSDTERPIRFRRYALGGK